MSAQQNAAAKQSIAAVSARKVEAQRDRRAGAWDMLKILVEVAVRSWARAPTVMGRRRDRGADLRCGATRNRTREMNRTDVNAEKLKRRRSDDVERYGSTYARALKFPHQRDSNLAPPKEGPEIPQESAAAGHSQPAIEAMGGLLLLVGPVPHELAGDAPASSSIPTSAVAKSPHPNRGAVRRGAPRDTRSRTLALDPRPEACRESPARSTNCRRRSRPQRARTSRSAGC